MNFGEFLKEFRLYKNKGKSPRKFAIWIGLKDVLDLKDIEEGKINPPYDERFIRKIILRLDLDKLAARKLRKLWDKSKKNSGWKEKETNYGQ